MGYLFETETCSRCRGTGNYSFCQEYGTRCFKCAGSKVVLTRRGTAARRFLDQLQTVYVRDLRPGMLIEDTHVTNGGRIFRFKTEVVSADPSDQVKSVSSSMDDISNSTVEYFIIKTKHSKYGNSSINTPGNSTTRVWPNTQENIAKALQYQAVLTKTGSVSKKLR